ncbi:hypothetical protein FO519_001263 [Halicephalobus sp. NKZ332]|nr:hypothetical protein FO519_001263 [Halicephalobus sp. NKZ332]
MDTETLDEKRNIARKLHALKETLDSSKFFDVYITFDGDTTKQYTEWIRCLKYDPIVIMDSVKRLLGSLHLKYVPEKKQRNSNFGLVFDYSHDGTTESYYLKANETNWVTNPDARELIVYLLLQRIGIGPSKYYFIPGDAKLETVIYIATLKVPGFTMAKDLDNPLEEVAAVELHLLAIILNLIDPNTSDYGLDIHGSLTIVDFSLTKTYKDSACAMYFKEHVRRQPALVNLDKCPGWKRVMIGKEAMKRWNLEKVIEQTEEDFLKIKEELNKEVEFLDRASCGIKDHLESIKWNVQKLISDWDEDSSQ